MTENAQLVQMIYRFLAYIKGCIQRRRMLCGMKSGQNHGLRLERIFLTLIRL